MDHFNVDLLNAVGITKVRYANFDIRRASHLPPSLPVRVITFIPFSRAAAIALITFAELPEVEIPSSTSPSRPTAST
mgnify:CR=1 FL=1